MGCTLLLCHNCHSNGDYGLLQDKHNIIDLDWVRVEVDSRPCVGGVSSVRVVLDVWAVELES